MATAGQELKRERELRGISLKEIADSTKINLKFLRALEEDQLDILMGKFLVKGIIRTYGKYLGLEEDTVLNYYYETLQHQEQAEGLLNNKSLHSEKPDKLKKILTYSFIAVFLVIVTMVFILINRKPEPEKIPVQLPDKKTVQQEKPIPVEILPVKKIEELSLTITFNDLTWMQILADNEQKLNGLQQPGSQFEVKAKKSLIITTGNAGGFTYYINESRGKALGASGDVIKNVKITLDNIKEFIE